MLKDILPFLELKGQFDKLTDRTETRSLSLPKGPFPNRIFIPSLTHPALKDVFSFRGYASASFREIPCSSVAMLLLPSVKFRVRPWQMLLLLLLSFHPSVAI